MISVHSQGKPFNITVIQVYVPATNAKKAEVDQFYEDPQDLLELTPQKDVLFIIGDWNDEFNSYDHYIYYRVQESLRRNGVAIIASKRV